MASSDLSLTCFAGFPGAFGGWLSTAFTLESPLFLCVTIPISLLKSPFMRDGVGGRKKKWREEDSPLLKSRDHEFVLEKG